MSAETIIETLQEIGIELSSDEEDEITDCIIHYGGVLSEIGRRFVSDPENIRRFLFKVQEAMMEAGV